MPPMVEPEILPVAPGEPLRSASLCQHVVAGVATEDLLRMQNAVDGLLPHAGAPELRSVEDGRGTYRRPRAGGILAWLRGRAAAGSADCAGIAERSARNSSINLVYRSFAASVCRCATCNRSTAAAITSGTRSGRRGRPRFSARSTKFSSASTSARSAYRPPVGSVKIRGSVIVSPMSDDRPVAALPPRAGRRRFQPRPFRVSTRLVSKTRRDPARGSAPHAQGARMPVLGPARGQPAGRRGTWQCSAQPRVRLLRGVPRQARERLMLCSGSACIRVARRNGVLGAGTVQRKRLTAPNAFVLSAGRQPIARAPLGGASPPRGPRRALLSGVGTCP